MRRKAERQITCAIFTYVKYKNQIDLLQSLKRKDVDS